MDGLSVDQQEDLKDDLHGEVDQGHPLIELLELPECSELVVHVVLKDYRLLRLFFRST